MDYRANEGIHLKSRNPEDIKKKLDIFDYIKM